MRDTPPPYTPNPPPSAPQYTDTDKGSDSKGVDWLLNSHSGNHGNQGAASAPNFEDLGGPASTKGIDWSLNRPGGSGSGHSTHPGSGHPVYPGSAPYPATRGGIYPAVPNTQVPDNPYHRWKEQFSRHYPNSKMGRDNPSIIRVEIPKNRAYPVVGHATCPECFDNGPHQTTVIKKRESFLSTRKIPAQKCRSCYKLVYFVQTLELVLDEPPVDRPPPYHNRPSQHFDLTTQRSLGHGWSETEQGHGWNPGDDEGHGWSTK